jgi:release factor glutamine methyltransferase
MRETISKMREVLRPIYGEREAEAIIREVFRYEKGWDLTDMVIHGADTLSDFIKSDIDKVLARLAKHEPIQYITGKGYFYGLELAVEPGVLIPRPETEELVEAIVKEHGERSDLRVLDACCGSGCIAVALSRNLRFPLVTALDLSETAVRVTTANAKALHCHIDVVRANVFAWNADADTLDILVSNPPYIDESERAAMERNVLDYEPEMALFVPDADPLRFYRRLARMGRSALTTGGKIYFEINPRHKDAMETLLRQEGYSEVESWRDLSGKYRFVKGSNGTD